MERTRKTGIDVIGDAHWGTHFCLFYHTKEDLIDILVPYFKAGLENNEFCMWVTSEPLHVEDAKRSLKRVVKNLDDYIEKGQIEILDYSQWYTKSGRFEADKVLQGWVEKEDQAGKRGFDGLRLTGNTFWLEKEDWREFLDYEATVDGVIDRYRMLALCTYSLDRCGAAEVVDVVSNHQFALIKREGKWKIIESAERKQAEETLRASARQWQTTFDAIGDAISLLDLEGRFLRCNKAMTELLGKPSGEIIGRACYELVHGTSEPIAGCPIVRMRQTGRRETKVVPIGDRWFRVVVDPLLDEDGNLIGGVHIISDVTERKRTMEAMGRRAAQLSLINDIGGKIAAVLELDSVLERVTHLVQEGFGYHHVALFTVDRERGEMVMRSRAGEFAHLYPPDHRLKLDQGLVGWVGRHGQTLLANDVDAEPRYVNLYPDVVPTWSELSVPIRVGEEIVGVLDVQSPQRDAFDENDVMVMETLADQIAVAIENARLYEAVQRELTERKQAEEALRESEERYRSIVEHSHAGILIVDDAYRFTYVNDELSRILGYSREEIIGQDFQRFLDDESKQLVADRYVRRQRGEKVPPRYEFNIVRKDGEKRRVEISSTVIKDSAGKVKTVAQILDITERKQAEEALKRRAEQLTALSRASQAVTASLELDQVLAEIVSLAGEVSASDYTSVVLVDEAGHLGESAENVSGAPAIEFRIRDEGLTSWIVRLRQAVVIEIGEDGAINPDLGAGAPRTANPFIVEAGVKSVAGLPLLAKDRLLGVLYLHSLRPAAFHDQLPLLTTFANQVAIAIENARLYDAARQELAERKRVLEALRESEERYRRLVDFSPEMIAVYSEGKIIYINAAGVELLGAASPEELTGKPIMDFVHPDSLEIIRERVRQSHEQGEATPPIEERLIRPDGQVIDVETTAVPITYQGKPATLAVARDMTERKRAEEALRAAEARYRTLVEQLPAIIYTVELGEVNRTTYISPQVESLLGFTQAEWLADPDLWTKQLHPDDRERVPSEIRRKDAGGEPLDLEYRVLARDGRVLWFRNQAVLGRDETGRIRSLHGVMFDITERKQLEAQLHQAQKLETLGSLAAGIAHDFNNLLTPISGFAALLLRKAAESSQQREYLRYIQVAAGRAAALTYQLRLFTRQEEGERHPVQLNSVVEETRDLLEHSIPKEITIELRLESELWAVEADPSQISQVLMNLCVNARDAMPDGGTLTLETRNVTLDEEYARAILGARPGRYVCLSVSDTGIGMGPQVQARLFEPFFTTKEAGKGTGLGLSVVYGIVKGHGGFINVYSEEGRGSTFHVYLPAIELAVEGTEMEGLALPVGTETILLVDDEEMVLELGQGILESCGYTVLTAENGVQALEVYQAHRGEIALVVLDAIMPQMGGRECLRRLRELDPQVKVLISTGYIARGLAQELAAEGALAVVEKPVLLQDFATAVRTALDRP